MSSLSGKFAERPLVTRIARTGLGTRLEKDVKRTPLIFITISSFVARAERAGMSGESI